MPIFQTHEPIAAIKPIECQFVHPADVEKNVDLDQTTSDASQMVLYKGALVDIAKLMQQMSRAELAREQTEQRFNELIKTNNELQSSNSRAKDKLKDLQSELKSSHRKLSDAESGLTSANVSYNFAVSDRKLSQCFLFNKKNNFFSLFTRKRMASTIRFCPESTIKSAQYL